MTRPNLADYYVPAPIPPSVVVEPVEPAVTPAAVARRKTDAERWVDRNYRPGPPLTPRAANDLRLLLTLVAEVFRTQGSHASQDADGTVAL